MIVALVGAGHLAAWLSGRRTLTIIMNAINELGPAIEMLAFDERILSTLEEDPVEC